MKTRTTYNHTANIQVSGNLNFYISEIFHSIQGEGLRAGFPCVFIRFQGCNLRCEWCDTQYALEIKSGGTNLTGREIIEYVKSYKCNFIEITGGEPLYQKNCLLLMKDFCDEGYTVALETGGQEDLSEVDKRVIKILDLKCPSSMMTKRMKWENMDMLVSHDEVKFVVADRKDYEWANEIINKYKLIEKVAAVQLSPVFGKLEPRVLSEWILNDGLKVRLNLQMHKFIWEPNKRGV